MIKVKDVTRLKAFGFGCDKAKRSYEEDSYYKHVIPAPTDGRLIPRKCDCDVFLIATEKQGLGLYAHNIRIPLKDIYELFKAGVFDDEKG